MENQTTFKKAIILTLLSGLMGAVPAVIAAWQASLSSEEANAAKNEAEKIEVNSFIRQSRLDERDKILAENTLGDVLLVPVNDDDAWRLYLKCRDEGGSRPECAKNQREVILAQTSGVIGNSLQH